MNQNSFKQTKVVTGLVRFSYVHVFTPVSFDDNTPKKYSVTVLIPKTDTKTLAAVQAAKEALRQKLRGQLPPDLKHPLRDGDAAAGDPVNAKGDEYRGHWFVNPSSKIKPGVVDANLQPVLDPEEFYSGCYGRASITFYPFDVKVNRGIACGLNNLQKLRDGESLGGRVAPEIDFADGDVFADAAVQDAGDWLKNL